ncbi:hypothetical protein [Lysobacter sp. CA196]|uniref:hypothetical protein n=1 Tax=Lysobacter sp. CA196 TaxID=3455606 RepID=UPI003F8D47CF
MSVEIVSCPMTARELQVLAKFGKRAPGPGWASRLRSPRAIAVLVAAAGLVLVGLWRGPAWWLHALGAGSGWRFQAWSLALAVLACMAVRQSWSKRKAALGNRERLFGAYWADLALGAVDEERYEFEDALCLLEPESSGRIHLLKIDAARCLVVFDRESSVWRERGGDLSGSAMRPARAAVLRRAPRSGLVLSIEFAGPAFDKTPTGAFGREVPPWSLSSRVWEVRWDELTRRIGDA